MSIYVTRQRILYSSLAQVHLDRYAVAGTGNVYYMWRGCRRESSPADRCVSEVHFEECRETCSTDLCNVADMSVSRRSHAARRSDTTGTIMIVPVQYT